jgi:formamidopyrimidine-DNA glycosylase
MPELAEVAFIRKRWNPGLGHVITTVRLHPGAGVFKTCEPAELARRLPGARLESSEAAAKQMLFRLVAADATSTPLWLGIHLGMTGDLAVRPAGLPAAKADHLILDQSASRDHGPGRSLVFSDFRMFGRVQFHPGPVAPAWWSDIAPAITSPAFTVAAVAEFFTRRKRTPLKAALLLQARFPGIGNWMADEILWRAALHPARLAGSLTATEMDALHRETVWVATQALALTGETFEDPPASWLFAHRWADGGLCPRTQTPLQRATIGGRTTCWSPARQQLR